MSGRLDALAAAALSVGALAGIAGLRHPHHLALAIPAALAVTVSVGWRRRLPVPMAVIAISGLLGYQAATWDGSMTFEPLAVLLVFYGVGRYAQISGRLPVLGGVLAYALGAFAVSFSHRASGSGTAAFAAVSAWVLFAILPSAAGWTVRRRAARTAELAANLERLKGEDELRMKRLAAEERHRVARELHDVVGHCVSVMVIQASGARLIADSDPLAARGALGVVESSGREALADLRRTMGVLRRTDGELAGPAPGMGQLDVLVEKARSAGLPTELRVTGNPVPLPPGLDLIAYRVVQEALTNAVKHAGPARAAVRVSYRPDALELTVTDDGGGAPGAAEARVSGDGSGHGLLGMHERITLYGGQLRNGSRERGGYEVHARLPLRPAMTMTDLPAAPAPAPRPAPPSSLRRRSGLRELLIPGGWLAALVIEAAVSSQRRGPVALNLLAVCAMASASLWRRRFPLLFVITVGALAGALSSGLASLQHATVTGIYVVLVPTYCAAAWGRRWQAITALGLWLGGASIITAATHAPAQDLAGAAVSATVAWAVGHAMRAERQLTEALRDSTARLDAGREDRARLAVVGQRTQIARELHAMVARHVTLMVVQAEAAQNSFGTDRPAAEAAIRTIEQTGREALEQVRRLIGVLRNDSDEWQLQLQPGTARLHALTEPASEVYA